MKNLIRRLRGLVRPNAGMQIASRSSFDSYFDHPRISHDDYPVPPMSSEAANAFLSHGLQQPAPFMAARFGNVELSVLMNYLHNQVIGSSAWSGRVKDAIFNCNALFPPQEDSLVRFAELYLNRLHQIDFLGVWNNRGEELFASMFPQSMHLGPLESLEPYLNPGTPWSAALAGKKVLVVHPYEQSIQHQHAKLPLLFSEVFPSFELITYRPVNVLTDDLSGFVDWFDALDRMEQAIAKLDFDVALVAAGPFGLPLAASIKALGKKVVHVGGSLQLFFGIKGRRWENRVQAQFFNEHWCYPDEHETPTDVIRKRMDNGDYWK